MAQWVALDVAWLCVGWTCWRYVSVMSWTSQWRVAKRMLNCMTALIAYLLVYGLFMRPVAGIWPGPGRQGGPQRKIARNKGSKATQNGCYTVVSLAEDRNIRLESFIFH